MHPGGAGRRLTLQPAAACEHASMRLAVCCCGGPPQTYGQAHPWQCRTSRAHPGRPLPLQAANRKDPLWEVACDPASPNFGSQALAVQPDGRWAYNLRACSVELAGLSMQPRCTPPLLAACAVKRRPNPGPAPHNQTNTCPACIDSNACAGWRRGMCGIPSRLRRTAPSASCWAGSSGSELLGRGTRGGRVKAAVISWQSCLLLPSGWPCLAHH